MDETFTPSEAVAYLRTQRNLQLSVDALRQRRKRGKAQTARVYTNTAIWTKAELDALDPRTRRVAQTA